MSTVYEQISVIFEHVLLVVSRFTVCIKYSFQRISYHHLKVSRMNHPLLFDCIASTHVFRCSCLIFHSRSLEFRSFLPMYDFENKSSKSVSAWKREWGSDDEWVSHWWWVSHSVGFIMSILSFGCSCYMFQLSRISVCPVNFENNPLGL